MTLDRLNFLLERLVWDAPRSPVSPECLGIEAILRILDSPERIEAAELEHLTKCLACQRAVRLARRERALIEAPVDEEQLGEAAVAPPGGDAEPGRPIPAQRTIKLRPWLSRVPVAAGIAAALLIAVGVTLWSSYDPSRSRRQELLGPISGTFKADDLTRAGQKPERRYVVEINLRTDAYVTFIYLDSARKPKLPSDAQAIAHWCPAGQRITQAVKITNDPPGRQWLAAVASKKEFSPFGLRDKLQAAIGDLPAETPITELIARLEGRLHELGSFEFQGIAFDVPADSAR